MILDKMESAGFSLEVTGAGKLKVIGVLSEKQRCYIREHKKQLIMELRSRLPFYVRCIECTHFERIDHPHLGRCGAGVKSAAASSLFWSTDARGCDKFTEITGEIKCS